jgi:hypothetical protein
MRQQKWYGQEVGLRLLFSVTRCRVVWQICAKGTDQLVAFFFGAISVPFLPVFPCDFSNIVFTIYHLTLSWVYFPALIFVLSCHLILGLPDCFVSSRISDNCLTHTWYMAPPISSSLCSSPQQYLFNATSPKAAQNEGKVWSILLTWYSFSEFSPVAANVNSSYVLYSRYLCINTDLNSCHFRLNI